MQGQIVVSKTRLIFIGEPKRKMVNNEQELQDEFDKLSIEAPTPNQPIDHFDGVAAINAMLFPPPEF